jgi:hypothetical protein
VRLSRQDWRGPKAGWAADSEGYWDVTVKRAGKYLMTIRSDREFADYQGAVANHWFMMAYTDGTVRQTTETIELKAGDGRVEITVADLDGKNRRGPTYVELKYLGPVK